MATTDQDVEIEYVYETPEEDDLFKNFANVFEKFSQVGSDKLKSQDDDQKPDSKAVVAAVKNEDNQQIKETDGNEDKEKKISKKRMKQMTRMSVAELKQKAARPELVELHDVTGKYPLFLLHLKSTKNSVPVPRHWSSKRRYLQGKRGYEKSPFQLPDFILQTGIMEMRDAVQEKDSSKSLKAKTRERVQPKMGKIQLDYQQLHDAFFKWQTKPKLTIHGDLYYEGKEFERKFNKKPGELSNDLRRALGMPIGQNAHRYPPPWLTAMKRHGPPPSYPYLRIPGLNCPFTDDDDMDEGARSTMDRDTNASDGE